jgi:hypothetical protein
MTYFKGENVHFLLNNLTYVNDFPIPAYSNSKKTKYGGP